MHRFELTHLSDDSLLRDLSALVARDRATTAVLLAHIAEADARRLYARAGYSSMHEYCVRELSLSDDAAATRIHAARAARRFPVLFTALAQGSLHLTAVRMLAPHLTEDNATELIAMATHQRKSEIEEGLARRFAPLQPAASSLRPIIVRTRPVVVSDRHIQHVLEHVERHTVPAEPVEQKPEPVEDDNRLFVEQVAAPESEARTAPPSMEARYLLKVTLSKTTETKLRRAQTLLSHAVPNGDLAEVLDRALDRLIVDLERRKAGTGARPSHGRPVAAGSRHIPALIRMAVWTRDGGRCTFVNASGARCDASWLLEFDHVRPVARGGEATVEGIRLRCQAHNQYEAERSLGSEFMARKRHDAKVPRRLTK